MKHRTKPDSLDLTVPRDRVVILRAYHALLSQGLDVADARAQAARYALEHWDEVNEK